MPPERRATLDACAWWSWGVTLDEAQMWRLMDDRGCSWGALEPRIRELSQSNRRPVGPEEVIDGKTWLVYEITAPFTPSTPGPIDLGDLRIGEHLEREHLQPGAYFRQVFEKQDMGDGTH
jgi:hypothetical protein